jgi:hypothetical protein
MAQVPVRQTHLLRPEQHRNLFTLPDPLPQPLRPRVQPFQRLLRRAPAAIRCSRHHRAVRYRRGHIRKLFGASQHRRRPHSRPSLPKRRIVGPHHPQMPEPEIRHRSRRRPHVQRIPALHQHHPHPLPIVSPRHSQPFPARPHPADPCQTYMLPGIRPLPAGTSPHFPTLTSALSFLRYPVETKRLSPQHRDTASEKLPPGKKWKASCISPS